MESVAVTIGWSPGGQLRVRPGDSDTPTPRYFVFWKRRNGLQGVGNPESGGGSRRREKAQGVETQISAQGSGAIFSADVREKVRNVKFETRKWSEGSYERGEPAAGRTNFCQGGVCAVVGVGTGGQRERLVRDAIGVDRNAPPAARAGACRGVDDDGGPHLRRSSGLQRCRGPGRDHRGEQDLVPEAGIGPGAGVPCGSVARGKEPGVCGRASVGRT